MVPNVVDQMSSGLVPRNSFIRDHLPLNLFLVVKGYIHFLNPIPRPILFESF